MDIKKYRAGDRGPFDAIRRGHPTLRKVIVNLGNGNVAFCRVTDLHKPGVKEGVLKRTDLNIYRIDKLLSKDSPEMKEISSNGSWETLRIKSLVNKEFSLKLKRFDEELLDLIAPFLGHDDLKKTLKVYDKSPFLPPDKLRASLKQLTDDTSVIVMRAASKFCAFAGTPETFKDTVKIMGKMAEEGLKKKEAMVVGVNAMIGQPYEGMVGLFIFLSKNFGGELDHMTIIVPLKLKMQRSGGADPVL